MADSRSSGQATGLPAPLYFVVKPERIGGKDGYSAYWISRTGKRRPVGVHRETKQQCITGTRLLYDAVYWNPEDHR